MRHAQNNYFFGRTELEGIQYYFILTHTTIKDRSKRKCNADVNAICTVYLYNSGIPIQDKTVKLTTTLIKF